MKKTKFFMLLLLTIYCFCLSSFGQNKSLTFSTWIFTWDSLCDNFPVQDYYVFFPDSIVINQTMEDNVCSMGKYVLQDSLVFMKFYCDEKNYYYDTNPFDTIQYSAIIKGNTLLLQERGYWIDGNYIRDTYTIPKEYIFKRKNSLY